MQEFKNKSDYSIIAFSKEYGFLVKVEFSQAVAYTCNWLTNSYKYYKWDYVNVYVRRSGRYLGRYYKGGYIPQKPR